MLRKYTFYSEHRTITGYVNHSLTGLMLEKNSQDSKKTIAVYDYRGNEKAIIDLSKITIIERNED